MKTKLFLLSFVLLGTVNAQNLTVKFSTYDSCIGQPICFNDNSTSTNGLIKSWLWDFGDGNQAYTKSPCHQYLGNRTYTVKLVVTNFGGDKDSIFKNIQTYNKTRISFTINDTIQCLANNSFDYINTTKDTGSIYYHWDLGDNTFSNLNYVSGKTYIKDSSYTIKLISLNKYNCMDTLIKIIVVAAQPKADFNWGAACSLGNTAFTYKGSPVTLSYWNFNNEGASSLLNPAYNFKTAGIKKVSLKVISNYGCIDSIAKDVEVKPKALANFTVNDVCENDSVSFINQSKFGTFFLWKFGDGSTSSENNPSHLYAVKGVSWTYNVTLIAGIPGGCPDSIAQAVSINANPNSYFEWNYDGGYINLIVKQAGNTSYRWLFDYGDSITTHNASYKFRVGMKVCLKVINAASCVSETCREIWIGNISESNLPGFKIYPNPNKGNFTIEIETPSNDISIEVYDLLGNLIKTIQTGSSQKSYSIEMNVADGIYLVRVSNGGVVWNQKVSVMR